MARTTRGSMDEEKRAQTAPKNDRHGHPYVRSIDIKGKLFDVFVDNAGEFHSYISAKGDATNAAADDMRSSFGDTRISAASIDGLRKKLITTVTSLKADIRVPMLHFTNYTVNRYDTLKRHSKIDPKFETLYVRGIHASNDNVLVEDQQGNREQITYSHGEHFTATMPQAKRERYIELHRMEHEIEIEKEAIEETYIVDPKAIAKEALAQVAP